MTNILFNWCKTNPELSYKQGMNELLGVLIFVGYSDMPGETTTIKESSSMLLNQLNNKQHLEADLFWCFSKIMNLGISDLFNPVLSKQKKKKTDLFTWEAERNINELVNTDKSNESTVSPILRRSHKIHHQMLKNFDSELYECLEKHQIEPQMYLQRWLRCMLSREFSLSDCLTMWDGILASYSEDNEKLLEFLDFLCVAMIVFVRSFCIFYAVLQSDHFGILRRLLKFPPVEDVHVLISLALKFKNPKDQEDNIIETQIGPHEEFYSNDLIANLESVTDQLQVLISQWDLYRKVYDEYKYVKAVDAVYEIKCQIQKEFSYII